jgi:neutral ceramidase
MNSSSRLVIGAVLAVCVAMLAPRPVPGAETHRLRVGVARLDVTPKDLTGLINVSRKPFAGVREPIFVRALVLDDGLTTAAIVGIDFVEFGNTLPLRERIAKELAIPAAHIMIAASHDHSAPRGGPPTPGTSSVTQGRPYSTPAYTQQADDTIVAALRQAKAALQPAQMGSGTGQADVNVYRYAYTDKGWRAGINPDGPSDKSVWVAKFSKPTGEPIALLMNYAVHSNVMTGAGAANTTRSSATSRALPNAMWRSISRTRSSRYGRWARRPISIRSSISRWTTAGPKPRPTSSSRSRAGRSAWK